MGEAVPAIDPTVYRLKANAFVGRRTYRLTDNALTWDEEGKASDGVFYDDISEVRLAFAPTRLAPNRYRAQIIFRQGGMAELLNLDYVGFANFAAQDAAYAAFLTELHRRLATQGKNVAYRRGNSVAGYILNVGLTIFIFIAIALAFVLLFNIGGPWIAIVKLGIVLFFVPLLIRYIRRARPGTYDPMSLPPELLPGADKS